MRLAHIIGTTITMMVITLIASFVISAGMNSYDPSVNGGNYSHDANLTLPFLSEDRYTIAHTPISLPNTSGQGVCGVDITCK